MKTQPKQIINSLKSNPQLKLLQNFVQEQIGTIQNFWLKLTNRERLLVSIIGAIVLIFVLFTTIGAVVNFSTELDYTYEKLQSDKIKALSISKVYNNLSKISGNEFSVVKLERIKDDMKQVFGISNPDAIIQDQRLTVKADNISYESLMLFLDQLRKSYGLFPDELTITSSFNSGYVVFSAGFKVEE